VAEQLIPCNVVLSRQVVQLMSDTWDGIWVLRQVYL